MSALVWWLIPIGATILAVLWAMYRARPERPVEAHDAMVDLRRFQQAMTRPMPGDRETTPDRRR